MVGKELISSPVHSLHTLILFLMQDTFLTHVEDGTIILLGATTENPSFQLNSALLSRCRVIVLEKLQPSEIEDLLRRALPRIGAMEILDGPAEMTVKTGDHIRFGLSWQLWLAPLSCIHIAACIMAGAHSCLRQDLMLYVTLHTGL